MDLPADASASASGKPLEVALPDVDNVDFVNMPATFYHEGDETSWQQGLLPGAVGPPLSLSELELSESDSASSAASILGVCLHGFDAWMSDAEGAHNDIQVGEAAGVDDSGDIPWRTTAWSAGGEELGSVKVVKKAGESFKRPSSALRGKTITSALQRVAPSGNDVKEESRKGGFSVGHVGNRQAGGGVPLTPDEKKEKRRVQNQKQRATQKPSTSQKDSMVDHPAVLTAVMPKSDTHDTLKCFHKKQCVLFPFAY